MDSIYVTAGLCLLVIVIYYYMTKNYGYWKRNSVPYLKDSLPGLGNVYPILFMRKSILQMYQEFYEAMPGRSMVGFYNLRDPALLIRDPELVKSVLLTNFSSFGSNGLGTDSRLDRLLSGSPLVLEGHKWKAVRQQLSSAYTPGKLKYMYGSIDATCEKLSSYLDDKIAKGNEEYEVELTELFAMYAAEVVGSAAFGFEGNSFNDDGGGIFTKIGKIIFGTSFVKGMKQFAVVAVPGLANILDMGFIPRKIEKIFINLVRDMVKYRADHNVKRNDFLQLMIDMKNSGATDHANGGKFDDDTIAGHSAVFFFDGYETPSVTLSFVGYLLAIHREVQQRVREEVFTVVEKYDAITYEALNEMTYTEKVMYEALRLYPEAGVLIKVCTKEIELKGPDGITCRVKPGTHVMIPVGGLQMDPEYWPEPEKFDPERFSEENKQNRNKFTYLAFGEGPRVCMGTRLSMAIMKAAIATILQKYTLELSPKTKVPLKVDPGYPNTTALGGVWAKFRNL